MFSKFPEVDDLARTILKKQVPSGKDDHVIARPVFLTSFGWILTESLTERPIDYSVGHFQSLSVEPDLFRSCDRCSLRSFYQVNRIKD